MSNWITICDVQDIAPSTGVCALVGEEQVAVFRSHCESIYAVGNYCPAGKAMILSRGIIAEIKGNLTVASPLYKQHYSLTTGKCLEEDFNIPVYQTRIENGQIQVAA
jgi:nitrite reductase (NADH) small subunit